MADNTTTDDKNTALLNAANLVSAAEKASLQSLLDAYTDFDAKIKAIGDSIGLPANYPSNARRIINETRANYSYRLTQELPDLLRSLSAS